MNEKTYPGSDGSNGSLDNNTVMAGTFFVTHNLQTYDGFSSVENLTETCFKIFFTTKVHFMR